MVVVALALVLRIFGGSDAACVVVGVVVGDCDGVVCFVKYRTGGDIVVGYSVAVDIVVCVVVWFVGVVCVVVVGDAGVVAYGVYVVIHVGESSVDIGNAVVVDVVGIYDVVGAVGVCVVIMCLRWCCWLC